MAMSNSDPVDWTQFLHHDAFVSYPSHLSNPITPTSISAESTVVTTVPARSGSGGGGGSGRSTADRHGGKAPPRKRSRSSRSAPTTLLNTDTANFRAMVQQFTGVATEPFTASYAAGGQSAFNFGFGSENQIHQPAAVSLGHQVRQKRYQYQPPPQQQEEMMRFSMAGNGVGDDEPAFMPAYLFDGMAGTGQLVMPGQMEMEGGSFY